MVAGRPSRLRVPGLGPGRGAAGAVVQTCPVRRPVRVLLLLVLTTLLAPAVLLPGDGAVPSSGPGAVTPATQRDGNAPPPPAGSDTAAGPALSTMLLTAPLLTGRAPIQAATPVRRPGRTGPSRTWPEAEERDRERRATARRCRSGRIALSFDDGPSRAWTANLARWLVEHEVPATFFMVGSRVQGARGAVRAVARHPQWLRVANHTWSHRDLRRIPGHAIRRGLRDTERALRRAGARPSPLMRPPYGALDPEARRAIRRAGLIPVLWNVDSRDWEGGPPRRIADLVLSQLRRGPNVVLQHDGVLTSGASVAAVPRIVREARRRGYCFVPLTDAGRPAKPVTTTR